MANSSTNVSLGRWESPCPLEVARSHSPTAEHNGKLYVFGGGGPNFQSLNSVVCFDPKTEEWSPCCDMPTLRSGAAAATVGDSIYVIGGGFRQEDGTFKFLRTVDIYHPNSDSWSKGPDMLMPHDYPAVAVLDGYIYILGGHHPDATLGGPKTDPGFDFCERLNPDKGEWEQVAPLPTPRFALSALVVDGKILAMGGVAFRPEGFNNFTIVEVYDPATNSWQNDAQRALPWPAAGLGAAKLDERLYIFGGYSDDDIHNRTACYDPAVGEWRNVAGMPAPIAAMGVAVCDNAIYSVGGWADDGRTPITNFYVYHPE